MHGNSNSDNDSNSNNGIMGMPNNMKMNLNLEQMQQMMSSPMIQPIISKDTNILLKSHSLLQRGQTLRVLSQRWMQSK
jgi:hypothetical protein